MKYYAYRLKSDGNLRVRHLSDIPAHVKSMLDDLRTNTNIREHLEPFEAENRAEAERIAQARLRGRRLKGVD